MPLLTATAFDRKILEHEDEIYNSCFQRAGCTVERGGDNSERLKRKIYIQVHKQEKQHPKEKELACVKLEVKTGSLDSSTIKVDKSWEDASSRMERNTIQTKWWVGPIDPDPGPKSSRMIVRQ